MNITSSLCCCIVPWFGEGSACCFHVYLASAILGQMGPFQLSSSSSLHRLAGCLLSWSFQMMIRNVRRLFRILMTCPAQIAPRSTSVFWFVQSRLMPCSHHTSPERKSEDICSHLNYTGLATCGGQVLTASQTL